MLIYSNLFTSRVFIQIYGSVLPKIMFTVILLTIYSFAITYIANLHYQYVQYMREELGEYIEIRFFKPLNVSYGPQTFGTLCSFAVCFRINIAWARYTEGQKHVNMMFCNWRQGFGVLLAFMNATIVDNIHDIQKLKWIIRYKRQMAHWFSLGIGLFCEKLVHSDLDFMAHNQQQLTWRKRVLLREEVRYYQHLEPTRLPDFHCIPLIDERHDGHWDHSSSSNNLDRFNSIQESCHKQKIDMINDSATFANIQEDHSHPTLTAMGREEVPGLFTRNCRKSLHAMRRDRDIPWILDSYDSKVSDLYKIPIICELTEEERSYLRQSTSPADLVFQWVLEAVPRIFFLVNHTIAPPIYATLIKNLQVAHGAFEAARLLSNTPFPFIFNQLLGWMLLLHCLISPIIITMLAINGKTSVDYSNVGWALIHTVPLVSLNETAKELENPFSHSPNGVPLLEELDKFVEIMCSLYHAQYPIIMPVTDSLIEETLRREKRRVEKQNEIDHTIVPGSHDPEIQIKCGLRTRQCSQYNGIAKDTEILNEIKSRSSSTTKHVSFAFDGQTPSQSLSSEYRYGGRMRSNNSYNSSFSNQAKNWNKDKEREEDIGTVPLETASSSRIPSIKIFNKIRKNSRSSDGLSVAFNQMDNDSIIYDDIKLSTSKIS